MTCFIYCELHFFICSSPHGCTLLTVEVTIYFILGSFIICFLLSLFFCTICFIVSMWNKISLNWCLCRAQIQTFDMNGHFCLYHLTRNSVIISDRLVHKFTNPIWTVIFAYQLIRNNDVSEVHKHTDLTYIHILFFVGVFFHRHCRFTEQQGKGMDRVLFHFTTFTRSRTFRHSSATLYMKWLPHIFSRIACVYQIATRWDLPPYWITIWLIDNTLLVFVCLLNDLILSFCYSHLTQEAGVFELASTALLVLQANRLIKCASHPSYLISRP